MQRVLIDTDILSEILVGRDLNVEARKNAYVLHYNQPNFTSFSVFEILSGLRKRDAKGKLGVAERLFAANVEVVPEPTDYRLGADIVGDLLKAGHPIGIVDPLIAACALRLGCAVATGNTDHFKHIQAAGYNLLIENWREP